MPEPTRRTFEELEAVLGTGWTKEPSEAPMGVCVHFRRTWPCGCQWAESDMILAKCRLEWLFPCEAHAELGFAAEFKDEVWIPRGEFRDLTNRRKGVLVTPELLPTLIPGQVLRIRSNACAEANGQATVADRLAGAWLWFVREPDPEFEGVRIEQDAFGPISSVGTLSEATLAANEVRLVSRNDERWPTGPVWVLKELRPQAPVKTSPVV